MDKRFDRTKNLIGEGAVQKLLSSKVAIFGVGGVGSFVAEALARGGVGALDLYDSDKVDITNINRQIIALESTVGKNKTDVMKERILDINPKSKVSSNVLFVTPSSSDKICFDGLDYIVDAVDTVTAKIFLAEKASEYNIPIISAMGAGNRLDNQNFKVSPIEKTSGCPLARVMRNELRKRNITGVKAVYSDKVPENITKNDAQNKTLISSISFVPSVMGLIIAGEVIKDLIGWGK